MEAILMDIDGVLTVSWRPLPGAVAAVWRLRDAGLKIALLTNTTSRTRASIAATLEGAGFPVTAGDVLTAPALAAGYLAEHYPGARCLLLNSGDIRADLEGVVLVDDHPAVRAGLRGLLEDEDDLRVAATAATAREGFEAIADLRPQPDSATVAAQRNRIDSIFCTIYY